MRCILQTHLDISADSAWNAVKRHETLLYVTRGFIRFAAQRTFPSEWTEGCSIQTRLWFFGILPAWWLHHLAVVRLEDNARQIQSQEQGSFYTWEHSITVSPALDGCLYRDEIEIHAGVLTFLVWTFAQIFYRYRQRRWRRLACGPFQMPNLAIWKKALQARHGDSAADLARQVQQRYRALMRQRALRTHPALRQHLEKIILPGLALYQVLLETNQDRQAALDEAGELLVLPRLSEFKLQSAVLRLWPDPYKLLTFAFPRMMRSYPSEGWEMEQVELSDQRIAFNAHRCFYYDTLVASGAPELTAKFCQTDDVGGEYLLPSIRFLRSNTIGRGGEVCDFQYLRVPNTLRSPSPPEKDQP